MYMTEKRLNNTIFLMYVATDSYCKAHKLTPKEFLKIDEEHGIINYISECPDIFDSMTDEEMVEEIERYVS